MFQEKWRRRMYNVVAADDGFRLDHVVWETAAKPPFFSTACTSYLDSKGRFTLSLVFPGWRPRFYAALPALR
jgi:hypothetical protein